MSADDARALTDRIKAGVEAVWELIKQAYVQRAWDALGYPSWDDYCTREFGTSRLRLPREERAEVVASLRESGLSIRAIEAVTGISRKTVIKDINNQVVETPPPDDPVDEDALAEELIAAEPPGAPTESTPGQTDRVAEALDRARQNTTIGVDGKRYPAKPRPRPEPEQASPRRRPLVDTARELGLDLAKLVRRLEKFGADDRLVRNRNEVAPLLRHHLAYAIKVCQDLDHQIDS
ncbi:hypothetical protein [Mycobacterium heckeshornense]|uniref:hypothetical protein n=1 Tax=Mycobacterium heckeshornense TaxID=110505 RepID=UPI0011563942|nr:hypothetical protein [Mycobacterium heckeshornense]